MRAITAVIHLWPMGLYLKCSTRDSPPHCRETPRLINTLNVVMVTGLGLPPCVTFSVRAQPLAALVERSVMAKVVPRAAFPHLHPPPCSAVKDGIAYSAHWARMYGTRWHGCSRSGPLGTRRGRRLPNSRWEFEDGTGLQEKADRAEIMRKEENTREISSYCSHGQWSGKDVRVLNEYSGLCQLKLCW